MKERGTVCSVRRSLLIAGVSAAVVLVLAFLWLYGYRSRKSNDNLPGLSFAAEMEERELNSVISGYGRNQLEDVWGKPDQTEEQEDRWKLEDGGFLRICYDQRGKVRMCSLELDPAKNLSEPPADTAEAE